MSQKGGEQIQESFSSLSNLGDGEGDESLEGHRLRCDFGAVYCPFMGHFSVWRAGYGMDSLSSASKCSFRRKAYAVFVLERHIPQQSGW